MRKRFFSSKEYPLRSALLSFCVCRDYLKPFLWLMKIFDFMLAMPIIFDPVKTRYKKNSTIRLTIFSCLYYDKADYFLTADSHNNTDQNDTKLTTVFNLLLHFKDEFPALEAAPHNVFDKLMIRHAATTEHYIKIYLNKFTNISNYSRNRRHSAKYFKYLFDIGIRHKLLDTHFISTCVWSTVINQKEYMFDALNDEGYVYDLTEHEESDIRFIKELLKMKGKSPYEYMTYCNPHYHRFCLLLLT